MAYVTPVSRSEPDAVLIAPAPGTGLKVPSMVRFDKIATISKDIIAGRLGFADPKWLASNRNVFFGVFGF